MINTVTGSRLKDRLMVIFLKGQLACGLCHCGMLCLSPVSGKGLFELDFCSFPHGFGLFVSPPCHLDIYYLILESECV